MYVDDFLMILKRAEVGHESTGRFYWGITSLSYDNQRLYDTATIVGRGGLVVYLTIDGSTVAAYHVATHTWGVSSFRTNPEFGDGHLGSIITSLERVLEAKAALPSWNTPWMRIPSREMFWAFLADGPNGVAAAKLGVKA